ncbi:MAG: hypothetical protein KDG55_09400 [Rhodocyclaceae bacterium]|nr:hypothetical protein [Rhodocyclaceae bacterium]
MSPLVEILLLTTLAGACIPLGGLLASIERFRPHWLEREFRHFVIAFGGGILLGALAVVLVPEGKALLEGSLWTIPIILAGGLAFFAIERVLGLRRREAPQLMGMILDFMPEAVALGGMMASESPIAPLLALLIGLQNLPEGFNAYRELRDQGRTRRTTLATMSALVAVGPASGVTGYLVLSDHPSVLGGIMLFASGGILYLIFQDIAPQSRLDRHWGPPLGAVLGFCLALFSRMLAGG